jgi:drug/metabolite transporter (DMT)-like permease
MPSERNLSWLQIVGVIAICAGVIGLGAVEGKESPDAKAIRRKDSGVDYKKTFLALLFPLLYCLLDAAGTFADSLILVNLDEESANVAYELTFLAMAVFAFIYVICKHGKFRFKREWPKGAAAVCETAGQFAYVFAIAAKPILAAPVIASYCAVSVVWGRIILKEKLSYKHYIMIGLTFSGIIALGICDGLNP